MTNRSLRFTFVFFLAAAAVALSAGIPAHGGVTPCPDVDLDGYADCTVPGCDTGGLLCGDCDDGNDAVNPAEVEVCNQTDDDCDGLSDEGFSQPLALADVQDVVDGNPSDYFGSAVAGLGDVTGDGIDDFVVGVPLAEVTNSSQGILLVYSGADRSIVCRAVDPSPGNSDQLGVSVAALDDVNSDGFPDFAAGAPFDDDAASNGGSVLVFSGDDCAFIRKLIDGGSVSNDTMGTSVARVDDADGDGINDIATGIPADDAGATNAGAVRIYSGDDGAFIRELTHPTPAASDQFGITVEGIGDVDSDGTGDVAVGVWLDDELAGDAGSVAVYSGDDGAFLYLATSGSSGDHVGQSIARLDDVDGDMIPDFAAGAPLEDTEAFDAGAVVIFSGVDGSFVRLVTDPLSFTSDQVGSVISWIPDLNGDGKGELVAAALGSDATANLAGSLFLFDPTDGSIIGSELLDPSGAASEELGFSISWADVTGDDAPDILAGARKAESGEEVDVGKVVVFSFESDCDGDGESPFAGDCDDTDTTMFGANPEICDMIDNDCDGAIDEDDDGDGFDICADCDPANPLIYPGAPELCNGVDDDCNMSIDDGADADGDGVEEPCDCDDDDDTRFPAAAEICNHLDDNCGLVDEGFSMPTAIQYVQDTDDGAPADYFGASVTGLGDVDGDGIDDFAVGIPLQDFSGNNAGSVLVYSGDDRSIICRAVNPSPGNSDQLGYPVIGIPDINGDGFQDIAAGAIFDDDSATNAGGVLLFSGDDCSHIRTLLDPDSLPNDNLGFSLASIDDLSGDGIADLIVGNVLDDTPRGINAGSALVFNTATGAVIFKLTDPLGRQSDQMGYAVAAPGDLDFDGIPDILVGSWLNDDFNQGDQGAVIAFSGADGSVIYKTTDGSAGDHLGQSLAALDDIDGDGVNDFAAGAPLEDTEAFDAGNVVLFSGRDGSVIRRFSDPLALSSDWVGTVISRFPDFNGDGIDELLVGAFGSDATASLAGSLFMFDPTDGSIIGSELLDPNGAVSDELGFSISWADVTGDGAPEILAGARKAESGEEVDVGKVVVFSFESDCDGDGESPFAGDCDDTDTAMFGANPEICDMIDNDCDGAIDEDDDGDGFDICADCDPANPLIYPGAPELCNGVDDDCNMSIDDGADADGDGVEEPCDCDDDDDTRFPAAAEVCNHLDDNCGLVDEGFSMPTAIQYVQDTDDGAPADYFGASVTGLGDVDGDGVDDVAVGIPLQDFSGSNAGSVLVYSGDDGSIICRAVNPSPGNSDQLGYPVIGIPDINGDGFQDIAAGAIFDDDSATNAGGVLLFSGDDCSHIRTLFDPDSESSDNLGFSLASIDDLSGDGIADLIVGNVLDDTPRGINAGSALVFNTATGAVIFKLTDPLGRQSDQMGYAVAAPGDLDFDGIPDILVGSWLNDDFNQGDQGAVIAFSGADGSVIYKTTDGSAGDHLGQSLAALDDIDGDGVNDFAAGAPLEDTEAFDAGNVVLFSGRDGSVIRRFSDPLALSSDWVGTVISRFPDFNGDGIDELLVGAFGSDATASLAGSLFMFDPTDGSIIGSELLDPNGAVSDELGFSISWADVTGDGAPEILAGARKAESGEEVDVGKVVVFSFESDCDGDGESPFAGDCDDTDTAMFGANPEICDMIDNDCDGAIDEDDDGDGFDICADCDPANPLIYPGAPELCNGVDDDCNMSIDDGADADGDGVEEPCDCDDSDDTVNPSGTETCDRRDEDCDGFIDEGFTGPTFQMKLVDDDPNASSLYGRGIAGAGDANGDGAIDFLIGSPFDDVGGSNNVGSAILYSGRDRTMLCRATDPVPASSDQFGESVLGLDDIDGDGAPDFAVGAFGDDDVTGNGGTVSVFSGADCSFIRKMFDPDSEANDNLGETLALLSDLTGDGIREVAASSHLDDTPRGINAGSVVVFNPVNGAVVFKLTDPLGRGSDQLGRAIAALDDVNFDGIPDIGVGSWLNDHFNQGDQGAVLVFSGADGSVIYKTTDGSSGDHLGRSLAALNDVDGDGIGDFAAGAPLEDTEAFDGGSVVVFSGADGSVINRLGDPLALSTDQLGISLAAIGDLTGDGIHELATGAWLSDAAGANAGSVFILDPVTGLTVGSELTDNDANANDEFGRTLAVIGDIQNGGTLELIVGVSDDDDPVAGSDAGSVVLFSFDEYDCDMDGLTPLDGDCNDDSDTTPGPEICDLIDNDCDGTADEDFDLDLDTFSTCGGDCNDGDATIFPGAVEGIADGVDQDCDTDEVCYEDLDNDTYGTSNTVTSDDLDCIDAGEADDTTDCNDGDGTINPGATEGVADGVDQDCDTDELCYTDNDADSFGTSATLVSNDLDCTDPAEADDNTDCDDTNNTIFPGATEGVADGVDQDCDTDEICYEDLDGDTFGTGNTVTSDDLDCTDATEADDTTDCDDTDNTIFPGATEGIADGVDQDCDTDEICYEDLDGDTFGTGNTVTSDDLDCTDATEADDTTDCDDTDNTIFPGATEGIADGVDQDCDTDEICYEDLDGDTFGTGNTVTSDDLDCTDATEADDTTDCDDTDNTIFPGATEGIADGVDQDCDTDEICYEDLDGDTFGTGNTVTSDDLDCLDGTEADDATDCDDTDNAIFPGATEGIADGVDQDCDTDEICYEDLDIDSYGTSTTVTSTDLDCSDAGEADDATDCDDGDNTINPGATEGPADGIDQNCDTDELCYTDTDGDSYGTSTTQTSTDLDCLDGTEADDTLDCNDGDAGINPGATEGPADGVDQNCDTQELCYTDIDGDSYGTSTTQTSTDLDCLDGTEADDTLDCDDTTPAINPGATEIPGDEVDQNCDTDELCYVDGDMDTYGISTTLTSDDIDCSAGGESTNPDDCDDADAGINPGATEIAGDGIDQNCDGVDNAVCFVDGDGDGFGTTATVNSMDNDCDDPGESDFDTDCDDGNAAAFPGATETADDGIDQDCNGADTITCFVDGDQDGFGSTVTTLADDGSCDTAQSEADDSTDCNDGDAGINPGTTEGIADGVDQDCDTDELCYEDLDNDSYGTVNTVTSDDLDCIDAGEADDTTDCNDGDAGINPGATEGPGDGIDQNCDTDELCYVDGDIDTYGSMATLTSTDLDCADAGEADDNTDCDDGNAGINPGASESAADGVDQDCDGGDLCYTDGDGDSYGISATVNSADLDCLDAGEADDTTDCDDADAAINPGAIEGPGDEVDQNCDGQETCYVDGDGDTYGTSSTVNSGDVDCVDAGESTNPDDCDDGDPAINPGATEIVGNGIDENCDGLDGAVCFIDNDLDGFGGTTTMASADDDCDDPGESDVDTDCDDGNAAVFPGAAETADDGIDQDCNGSDTITCFVDGDQDGFGSTATTLADDGSCDTGDSESGVDTDCDDTDAGINPGAAETADDGIDQDCNGADTITCFVDGDQDGFGTTATTLAPDGSCDTNQAESTVDTDCNDGDAASFPGASEVPDDGIDQDCNGSDTITCFVDGDQDGYGTSTTTLAGDGSCDSGQNEAPVSGDCNDGDAAINPAAQEVCDSVDNNCDGTVDEGFDLDSDGFTTCNGDCDDGNGAINPGALEVCDDMLDNDCDTLIDDADLMDCGSEVTICSGLGDTLKANRRDQDVFTFSGTQGEQVTLTLAAINSGDSGQANLILTDLVADGNVFSRVDRGPLPGSIVVTLPQTQDYQVIVSQILGRVFRGARFDGDYCLTLEADMGAAPTLAATATVETSTRTAGTVDAPTEPDPPATVVPQPQPRPSSRAPRGRDTAGRR